MHPKFCINCGTELPSQAKFCPNCGTAVAIVDQIIPKMQKMTVGSENGHEWIDLGLSVKWASCNIGAKRPEDYGDYFAWGEVSPKKSFEWFNYRFLKRSLLNSSRIPSSKDSLEVYSDKLDGIPKRIIKYGYSDRLVKLDFSDDAAKVNWGGQWRIPSDSEFGELVSLCTWAWTKLGGKNGYKVTGPNGNSIFLPAAGNRNDVPAPCVGSSGYYWTSILDGDYLYGVYARTHIFNSSVFRFDGWERASGVSVRPVTE